MMVNGLKITHNEIISYSQLCYLRDRYESLENRLERMIEKFEALDVTIDTSNQSESLYITLINDSKDYDVYEWSVRNHNNFTGVTHDKNIFMSHFDRWIDVRKEIISEINNKIKEWGYKVG